MRPGAIGIGAVVVAGPRLVDESTRQGKGLSVQTIWIELPTIDLERAKDFYGKIFGHSPTEERPGNGLFAPVADSEGNALTLHSISK